jgi:mono/diheme cytochrome c family protein
MKKLLVAVALGMSFAGVALADSAADIYGAKCKGCHGDDGKAHTKMGKKEKIEDMTSAEWQGHATDADIKDIITNGSTKSGSKMKAFKDKLSPAEIDSLVAYIRQMKGK